MGGLTYGCWTYQLQSQEPIPFKSISLSFSYSLCLPPNPPPPQPPHKYSSCSFSVSPALNLLRTNGDMWGVKTSSLDLQGSIFSQVHSPSQCLKLRTHCSLRAFDQLFPHLILGSLSSLHDHSSSSLSPLQRSPPSPLGESSCPVCCPSPLFKWIKFNILPRNDVFLYISLPICLVSFSSH